MGAGRMLVRGQLAAQNLPFGPGGPGLRGPAACSQARPLIPGGVPRLVAPALPGPPLSAPRSPTPGPGGRSSPCCSRHRSLMTYAAVVPSPR